MTDATLVAYPDTLSGPGYMAVMTFPGGVDQGLPPDPPTNVARDVSFSPDDQYLFLASRDKDTLYNTSDWSIIALSPAQEKSHEGCHFSADGKYLAIANSTSSPRLVVYNVGTWDLRAENLDPGGTCHCVRFSEDSSLLAFGHAGGNRFSVFNTSDWSQVTGWSNVPTWSRSDAIAISNAANVVAVTRNESPFLQVYDLTTKALLWTSGAEVTGVKTNSKCVDVNPDGTLLALGIDGGDNVVLYNPRTGAVQSLIAAPDLPNKAIEGLRFSRDGKTLGLSLIDVFDKWFYDTTTWAKSTLPSPRNADRGFSVDFNGSADAGPEPTAPNNAIMHGMDF